ncbi:MAG TPA: glycosyltransferase family 4 protein [Blastocatellia bacterium]|nr:glycosyltransferase family 4 protein [Blastocatellia bacterium]
MENQTLRTEIERFRDLRRLARRIMKTAYFEAVSRLHELKGKLSSDSGKGYDGNFNATFQPYEVRIRYPVQAQRPRILHAIGNFWTGGSARLVVDLIERLGHRYEQQVIARDLPHLPAYVGLKIRQHKQFTSPRPALAILKEVRPDLLHVHYLGHHGNRYSELDWQWYNNLFQAAEKYGCKVIENINIPVPPYVSGAVRYYVYVSDYVRREFGRRDGRNLTVYPGSDFTLFLRRNPADAPDDCIGMAYRLEGDKLDERSIDVFIKVAQRRRGTKALIIGGGRFLETYRNAVEKAGVAQAVTFTGYVSYEALPALYEQMSVFVAPVHRESFGQVAPFAMSMGIPVVGYDVGALKEIIGDESLLAPCGDSDRLADIIIHLLDRREERLRIGEANIRRSHENFSVEAMAARYGALYDEVMQSA